MDFTNPKTILTTPTSKSWGDGNGNSECWKVTGTPIRSIGDQKTKDTRAFNPNKTSKKIQTFCRTSNLGSLPGGAKWPVRD